MPINKSEKKDNQYNESRFKDRSRTPDLEKFANRPASLNGINKNLP
ncbi:hypothetical protein FHS18_002391 [Paenibacillus phyllosphaerae]|uniref:Uncharacterized protein n=1 Tax=Paenibacillus phyllosphaerae TaxID=274593 RepID=A0A7W5FMS9_9BACL|nr:hypothetical protein [Paenibacillus phyllosphaerae]MBB3110324.1 hypothetical protein [Paenibacillus phyllosphaerae]